jgi:hypothetical protein
LFVVPTIRTTTNNKLEDYIVDVVLPDWNDDDNLAPTLLGKSCESKVSGYFPVRSYSNQFLSSITETVCQE